VHNVAQQLSCILCFAINYIIQEFMTFLGTCGTEFEEINKEQKAMTREQKLMNASRRLSTKTLSIVADIKDKGNDNEEDA